MRGPRSAAGYARIHQDIIDTILETLYDDGPTLRRCATVARSFLSPCRRGLFAVISLCSVHDTQEMEKRRRLQKLLSVNPKLVGYVRELHVKGLVGYVKDSELTLSSLLEIFAKGRIHFFLFTMWEPGVSWDEFSPILKKSFLYFLESPSIRGLRFCGGWLRNFSLHNLGLLPGLKHLGVFPGCGCEKLLPPASPHLTARQLESLELADGASVVVNLLTRCDSPFHISQLREIHLCRAVPQVEDIVKIFSDTLESLIWSYPPSDVCINGLLPSSPEIRGAMDFRLLRSLRSLTFRCNDTDTVCVGRYLSECRWPETLRNLDIVIIFASTMGELSFTRRQIRSTFQGANLDPKLASLCKTTYPNLRRVAIHIVGNRVAELESTIFKQWFPLLAASGYLEGHMHAIGDMERVMRSVSIQANAY